MGLNDVTDDIQAQSETPEVFDRGCSFKGIENSLNVRVCNPDSLVADGEANLRVLTVDRDLHRLSFPVFHSVAKKISHHLLQPAPVPRTACLPQHRKSTLPLPRARSL